MLYRPVLFVTVCLAFPFFAFAGLDGEKTTTTTKTTAKTIQEIERFVQSESEKISRTPLRRIEDFFGTLQAQGELRVNAGRKMATLAADEQDREKASLLQVLGWRFIVRADMRRKNAAAHWNEWESALQQLAALEKQRTVAKTERYRLMLERQVRELLDACTRKDFDAAVEKIRPAAPDKPVSIQPLYFSGNTIPSSEERIIYNLYEESAAELAEFIQAAVFPPETKEAAKTAADKLERYLRRQVGSDFPIYGKTLENEDFDSSSLRGKYVLIEFTASWCGPCRDEIPVMKEAYEKYHGRGLEMLSVYYGDKPEDSKKMIKEEKIPWLSLSETLTERAGQEPQGKAFAVSGVPVLWLAGKDGKIIAVNIRGKFLLKKLAEIFPPE